MLASCIYTRQQQPNRKTCLGNIVHPLSEAIISQMRQMKLLGSERKLGVRINKNIRQSPIMGPDQLRSELQSISF